MFTYCLKEDFKMLKEIVIQFLTEMKKKLLMHLHIQYISANEVVAVIRDET